MKITRVEVWSVPMTLAEPYTIAYTTVETATNVFFSLVTDRDFAGFGCAGPDPEGTSGTPGAVAKALRDVARPLLQGADPLRRTALLEELRAKLGSQPSALAAVDMALFDILGKAAGLPLWKVLGGFRDRMKTSVTIGILPA